MYTLQVVQRRTAMAEYMRLNPKNETSWIGDAMLKALIAFSESQQNHKIVKADVQNGEIIVLIYLQEELKNLQEMPQSWKQNTAVEELKAQLVSMAPLLQVNSTCLFEMIFLCKSFMW